MGNTMHPKHERACFSLSYVVTLVLVAPFKIETLFTLKLMRLEARYSPSTIEVSHLKTKETMKTSQIYIFFHKPKTNFPFLFHFKQNKFPLKFVKVFREYLFFTFKIGIYIFNPMWVVFYQWPKIP
jgi:hypothetical protein